MVTHILIIIIASIIVIASFFIGFFIAIAMIGDEDEDDTEDKQYLYCFQCEFEMSVKEVRGEYYCANCGLKHHIKMT